jgi:hypothetical protein
MDNIKTLHSPIKVSNEHECQLFIDVNKDKASDKLFKRLSDLIELKYITLNENCLQITKSGHDYFMRKCAVTNTSFQFDRMAPKEIQQLIFETFFKGKPSVNTVEKFIKKNL